MDSTTLVDTIWFYLGLYDLEQNPVNKLNALMTAISLFSTLVIREDFPETKILRIGYEEVNTIRGPEVRQVTAVQPVDKKWVLMRFIPEAHATILAGLKTPTTRQLMNAEAVKFVLVQLLTAANWLGDVSKAFEKVLEQESVS